MPALLSLVEQSAELTVGCRQVQQRCRQKSPGSKVYSLRTTATGVARVEVQYVVKMRFSLEWTQPEPPTIQITGSRSVDGGCLSLRVRKM